MKRSNSSSLARKYQHVFYLVMTFEHLLPSDIKIEWSSCGAFLAVGGTQPVESISAVKFYNTNGHLRFTLNIPSQVRLRVKRKK